MNTPLQSRIRPRSPERGSTYVVIDQNQACSVASGRMTLVDTADRLAVIEHPSPSFVVAVSDVVAVI
jgi:hypothetical protein